MGRTQRVSVDGLYRVWAEKLAKGVLHLVARPDLHGAHELCYRRNL